MSFSPWRTIEPNTLLTEASLVETLYGGQAFRWNSLPEENAHVGSWNQSVVKIRLHANDLQASIYSKTATLDQVRRYMGSDVDWNKTTDDLPWRSDTHLAASIEAFRGLRLLKQPFAEALLCFLCSATKQIPQIRVMCENMAQEIGNPIKERIHSLPTWEKLSQASEDQLRSLKLGFRAKNIKKTADILAADPKRIDHIEAASYEEAKAALCELPGVGEKIADCALLFGARKWEAFPVDTWIIKTLEKRYATIGWNNAQLAHFGRIHFGPYAGFAQQFLFSYERMTQEASKRS